MWYLARRALIKKLIGFTQTTKNQHSHKHRIIRNIHELVSVGVSCSVEGELSDNGVDKFRRLGVNLNQLLSFYSQVR